MIHNVSIESILIVATLMFFIGVYGFITRKNLITILLSLELMINAVAINFVVFNKYLFPGNLDGIFFMLFIVAIAAAEAAIAIAIIINIYRLRTSIDVEETQELKY